MPIEKEGNDDQKGVCYSDSDGPNDNLPAVRDEHGGTQPYHQGYGEGQSSEQDGLSLVYPLSREVALLHHTVVPEVEWLWRGSNK